MPLPLTYQHRRPSHLREAATRLADVASRKFRSQRWVASVLPEFPKTVFFPNLDSSWVRDEGEILLHGFEFARMINCCVDVIVEAIDCIFDVFFIINCRVSGYCCGEYVLKFIPVGDSFTVVEVAGMGVKVDDKLDRVVIAG
ncbi:hypothetical protein TNCT_616511 [Trichonephila clavata]|uniref:Uncharacterized protein n=1 Tax=Trichonephila clavata TaxID=2740835 RepID=A0A8X6H3S8_TRICU|nr:hypothetical protein TNCT_616511 [Trichonephila clavata]